MNDNDRELLERAAGELTPSWYDNDRELLERAARAAGELTPSWYGNDAYFDGVLQRWNPLIDDGDALRLAVKLGLSITPYPIYNTDRHSVIAKQRRTTDMLRESNPTEAAEIYGQDPNAATRRAIVRAAAATVEGGA